MNKLDDAKFFAWLDGELPAAEALEIEALVAADAELAARAARHRALQRRLREAFDPIAENPVPEQIAEPLRASAPKVVSLAGRPRRRRPAGVPQWAAIAATLALGVFAGNLIAGGAGRAPIEARDGALYAAGSLDSALDRQLASAGADGGVRIVLTFRDQSGAICRSFAGGGSSGLACRDGDDWRLRGMFAAPEGQEGDYRMAAGIDPNLAALIDSTIAGDAFDAREEAGARADGWR